MTFRPIPTPAAPATGYGTMIDHLYAVNGHAGELGSNAARRPHWPDGTWIIADEFSEEEVAEMMPGCPLAHGVFFDNGGEFGSSAEDMAATDWMVRC